jgi:hypothetical protein
MVLVDGEGENAPPIIAVYFDDASLGCCTLTRKFLLQTKRALNCFLLDGLDGRQFLAVIVGNKISVDKHVEKITHVRSAKPLDIRAEKRKVRLDPHQTSRGRCYSDRAPGLNCVKEDCGTRTECQHCQRVR